MGVYDRTYQGAMVDDDGSGTTGTIYNKAAINSIMVDLEKGHYITDGDTYPFAKFDGTIPGLLLGVGDSTDLSALIKVSGAGFAFKDDTDTAPATISCGSLSSTGTVSITNSTGDDDAVYYPLQIAYETTGTAAAGFGIGMVWQVESDAGENQAAAYTDVVWTDASDGSEDADFVIKLMAGGAAAAEKFRVSSGGLASATAFAAGASPATAGQYRMVNTGWIASRNAANNDNVNIVQVNASDLIAFGPDRTGAGTAGNFSADFYIRFQDGSGSEFYVPGMNAAW